MPRIDALTGNECVAEAIKLCRPDIIAAYPITPQSVVVEILASMVANGQLESKVVDVESEHSSMSVVKGAAMLGKRVFTATAGQGLAYMYEPYFSMSTMRFPMVMTLACREMISPGTVWCGLQDALSVRDAGWMQVFCENNQEILDMVIQGYRISEDHDVLIPINVCYDGFYLSHQTERVELPERSEVDAYLPPIDLPQYLDVNNPAIVDPNTTGSYLIRYREDHLACMQHAKSVIGEANREFAERFGRDWGGLVGTYRMEDADFVLVTMGATAGSARVAVDIMRDRGIRMGLLKLRFMRPFPDREAAELLRGRKACGIIDRSVSFGWNRGILSVELSAACGAHGVSLPSLSFIGGLGGLDLRTEYVIKAAELTVGAASGGFDPTGVYWMNEDFLGEEQAL